MATDIASPSLSALQRAINADPSFPAFTANIQELLAIQENPYKTVNAVSSIILRDLSLTTQILKIVNSIFYQTYQRQVHTVSSAVMVLGFDRLRDLAVGLRLIEHFQKSSHLSHVKQLIVLSFLTAIQAQELVQDDTQLKAEEVFITGLLFNIGELIVAYYLPQEYQRILDLTDKGEAKSTAAQRVLKASTEEVGLAILKDWNLPDSMIKRLSFLHNAGSSGAGVEGRLRKMIKGAFQLSKNLLDPHIEPEERQKKEEKVCDNLGLNPQNLGKSLTASKKRLHEMAQVLSIDLREMEISDDIRPKDVRELKAAVEAAAAGAGAGAGMDAAAAVAPKSPETPVSPESRPSGAPPKAAESLSEDLKRLQFLYQVVEEVNQALVAQAPINQVLLMVLEGIFRGIRFDRVIFSLVNPQRTHITGRFGLGDGVEELLPLLHLPLKANGNAFALAMGERQEYLVNPHSHPGDRSLMEDNFWRVSRSHSFLVVPLHVDQVPIGAFFVDRLDSTLPISEEDRRRLRIFRDLTIIALRLTKKTKIFE
ncbi:MAG: HDOD domain-containing protein [Deltaproteobacteria bacterium]|nr:HDOD domain-containing protein [Deltaproteobacteria bacterium]MBI4796987.1 HDOD domain-containing protein [Deltaproteobacteria bacterium]